jgi:hypothetical protein
MGRGQGYYKTLAVCRVALPALTWPHSPTAQLGDPQPIANLASLRLCYMNEDTGRQLHPPVQAIMKLELLFVILQIPKTLFSDPLLRRPVSWKFS